MTKRPLSVGGGVLTPGRRHLPPPARQRNDVFGGGHGVLRCPLLGGLERGPRHLVEPGHRLRPRGRGEAHVVAQRGRRIGVAEPLLGLLDAVLLVDPGTSSTRRPRPAAGSRPPNADSGQRRNATTHNSTRESLHDWSAIRRFRQFCQLGRALPARWAGLPPVMNTRRRGGHGGCHDGTQLDPSRAIHSRAFGLQKGCRTGLGRRVYREKSLQMSGSAYGIRTRVTAVRGRPEGMPR